jgi:hypothetical protein
MVLVAALGWAGLAPPAHADIWECVDEWGNRRFTNIESEAKGCRLLDVGIPAAAPAEMKPPPKPAAVAPPPDFPKVDPEIQRARDDMRRRILEQELASEQKMLAAARRALEEQESIRLGSERNYQRVLDRLEPYREKVQLHESNVANLRDELIRIR